MHLKIEHIIILSGLVASCFALIPPGADNPFYKIESYYGSREQEFWIAENILNDDPADLYWYQNFFTESLGRTWIADQQNHIIGYTLPSSSVINVVAGKWGVQDKRNGAFTNARFNSPSALLVYTYNARRAYQESNQSVVIIRNDLPTCQYVSTNNITACQNTTVKSTDLVSPDLVKIVYPAISDSVVDSHFFLKDGKTYVFVVDMGNDCIRVLDLEQETVSTYAGQCGQSGFKDGPPEVNLLNGTEGIGIDELGNVFVYDAANNFTRMIDTTGMMYTMIGGVCSSINSTPLDSSFRKWGYVIRCYRKWIKTSGVPLDHLWTEPTALERCFKQDVLCGNKSRASPINYQNCTLRKDSR